MIWLGWVGVRFRPEICKLHNARFRNCIQGETKLSGLYIKIIGSNLGYRSKKHVTVLLGLQPLNHSSNSTTMQSFSLHETNYTSTERPSCHYNYVE